MRLSALFSAARIDAYGSDSRAKIERILGALNTHLAKAYPLSKSVYGSLRAMWMYHPEALQESEIAGLEEALGDHLSTEPVKASFDLLTGFHLDGGDPIFLYTFLEPYMSGVNNVSATTLLANEFQGSATCLFIEQNLLDPEVALGGLRTWIRYCLPEAVKTGKVIPGLGVMSWALFESNTGMRVTSPIHSTFVSYFMDVGIHSAELVEIAQSLLSQAAADFSQYDQGGFESWLKHDYMVDMLVYNPALACCLKGVPTPQIIERITPIITLLLSDLDTQYRRTHDPVVESLFEGSESERVRQALVNALCLFPDRLKEIGATEHEIAGDKLAPNTAISVSPQGSNRLYCSPLDALQVSASERWLAIRALHRLHERGFSPDAELSAKAALENRVMAVVLLKSADDGVTLRTVEEFFTTVEPSQIPDLDHTHIRSVIDYIHLPAYSEPARLNMALALVHRAIDIQKSRIERGMKRNNLVPLTFKSPRKVVTDWGRAMLPILQAFEQKGLYSHPMMIWAGFDSTVLQLLSQEAPRKIRDAFMAQDLGL